VTLSCGILVLSAAHILATGRYAGNPWSRGLVIAAVVGAALMMLRARSRGENARDLAPLRGRLVFGRHSVWVLYLVGLTAITSLGLLVSGARAALREPMVRRDHALPLDFPHIKHVEVPCARCHHNFVDARGMDSCIPCHRSGRSDLKVGIEARFHAFCFDCHRHPDAPLAKHGPVSGCTSCHRSPMSI
jgi:predicted CXXCH cytochrome family protein